MGHTEKVDVNNIVSIGFLCEFDEKTVKFYTLEHGLVEMENMDGDSLELAEWYDLYDGMYELHDEELEICKPYVRDGVVHVNTLAIGPNEWNLPEDIRQKYYMKVWSPWLKFLNDATGCFKDNVRGGDVREVICKFAPSDESVFEIVSYIDKVVEENTAACRLTPWTIEFIASQMDKTAVPEGFFELVARNHLFKPDYKQISTGVCIFHSQPNVASRSQTSLNLKGCKEFCSYIFSANMGLVRWTHQDDHVVLDNHPSGHVKDLTQSSSSRGNIESAGNMRQLEHRLATWVAFRTNDTAHKTENKYERAKDSLYRLTAIRARQFHDVPKRSRAVNGEVEIDASFLFNHDKLEHPESRKIPAWNERHYKLRKDAHFWDFDLGKVEIYPNVSRQIIETIETFRTSLTPELRERLQNEAIVIHGTTKVLKSWLENWKTYPEKGIFFLHQINVICYLNGGKLIYRR